MTRPGRGSGSPRDSGTPATRRQAAAFPIAEPELPRDIVQSGPYRLTFVRTVEELRALQRLRFAVFNLELGEGLASSLESGLDQDDLDEVMHHILISDRRTGEVVGTYRMQTAAMAAANSGFHTAREFDFSQFPMEIIDDAVEVGRACIAKDHRSRRVLHLLWRGLAVYLAHTGKHHLFGCCSLTTQDGRVGKAAHAFLVEGGHRHPHARVWPLPGFECTTTETDCNRPGVPDHRFPGRARRARTGAPCLPQLLPLPPRRRPGRTGRHSAAIPELSEPWR